MITRLRQLFRSVQRQVDLDFRLILLLVLFLAFALRIYRLNYQSFWWDEMYTAARSAMTVGELTENLFEARVHLPLYFVLLQGWTQIGRSEFIIRYFSVISGVLAVALIFATGRRLNDRKVGLVAAFLLAISPFHIWFSQEARMYSFLALNALAANWFLFRLLRRERRRDWAGYTVAMILTLYSHYLGVLILVAHYVFFSLDYRQNPARFKRWFICGSIAGAVFVVWYAAVFLISSFTQASISWIAPVNWYEPLVTLFSFSIGPSIDPSRPLPYVAFLGYLMGAVASLVFIRRRSAAASTSKRLSMRLLWLWLSVPLLLLTIVSIDWSIPQQRYIYMDRYIISTLPAFVLLAAWGVVTLTQQAWAPRWLLPLLLGVIVVPTWFTWQNLYLEPEYARENWRAAFRQIETVREEGDILLITPGQLLPYLYYGNELPYTILPSLSEEDVEHSLQYEINEAQADFNRVWLVHGYDNANTHGFPQTRNTAVAAAGRNDYEAWLEQHYTIVDEWQFTGIRLTLYDLQQPTSNLQEKQ